MVANTSAGMLMRVIADILVQLFAKYAQESCLRAREEGLAYAAALIEEMVVSDVFLIFVPKTFFHD